MIKPGSPSLHHSFVLPTGNSYANDYSILPLPQRSTQNTRNSTPHSYWSSTLPFFIPFPYPLTMAPRHSLIRRNKDKERSTVISSKTQHNAPQQTNNSITLFTSPFPKTKCDSLPSYDPPFNPNHTFPSPHKLEMGRYSKDKRVHPPAFSKP